MKFYDCQTAPSPRRARIFIAEKGLDIETIEIDLGKAEQLGEEFKREQLGEEFKRLNPRCTVPVLELDDGTCLTENAGIAAYLEALVPEPSLLGTSAEEKGSVADWNARMELEGLWPLADALRNRTHEWNSKDSGPWPMRSATGRRAWSVERLRAPPTINRFQNSQNEDSHAQRSFSRC